LAASDRSTAPVAGSSDPGRRATPRPARGVSRPGRSSRSLWAPPVECGRAAAPL